MDRKILKSVGIRGVNLYEDVANVQDLLNRVAPKPGGPSPLLKVDGLCGPKTKTAIQRFQLQHFGWKLADGRVDPGGVTLKKLNEVTRGPAITNTFMLFHGKKKGQHLRRDRPGDWFFLIEHVASVIPFPKAIFWFGARGRAPVNRPAPVHFVANPWVIFRTSRPCKLPELSGAGAIRRQTQKHIPQVDFTLYATAPSHPVRFDFPVPGGMDPDETVGPGIVVYDIADFTFTEYRGELQLVG